MRRVLYRLSTATLVVMVVLTVVGVFLIQGAVHNQERRLLRERANEVGLVLTTAVNSLSDQLDGVGEVLRSNAGSPRSFMRSTAAAVSQSQGRDTFAVLRRSGSGFVVVMVNGTGLRRGQLISDVRSVAMARALATTKLVPTQVVGVGSSRVIGFAIGPPVAPHGEVLYQQNFLGALGPPRAAATAPFSELHVALYASSSARASQALVATTDRLPLSGDVQSVPIVAGAQTWDLQVTAAQPLVGGATAHSALLTLIIGLALSILIALVIEIESRRRSSAIALYRGEHRLTEGLQLSLLPELPDLPGLDVGARYLAGAADQQVGGDWYDLFDLEDGRIGVVVGDVLGHDISAAAIMSRVQTALRAYAFLGEEPGAVLDRLDRLIATFHTDRLVTVFYGVLSAPDRAGARTLRYANAGHPPPLVHVAGGTVQELSAAGSLLLGVSASAPEPRPQAEVRLPAGSMLVLYTDGLVEVPGESLTDLLGTLKSVTATVSADLEPGQVCDFLLESMIHGELRDDVAILVAQLAPVTPSPRTPASTAATIREGVS